MRKATLSDTTPNITTIAIERLVANPDQPRRHFEPAALARLAESIKRKGVLQPILVRRLGEDPLICDFQIVAGERRFQAARLAGLWHVPVFVRDCSDGEALEIGVIENDNREALSPIEEARAFYHLMTKFGYTQHEISLAVGRSRPYVANALRLLRLPGSVQMSLIEGRLSAGHAKLLLMAYDPAGLAQMIIRQKLTVRAAEKIVRREKRLRDQTEQAATAEYKSERAGMVNIAVTEHFLREKIGLKLDLRDYGERGYIKIRYESLAQFQDLVGRLSR